ncbi:glycosyltransferase family 2 protein [Mucilaginibacter sp. UYCu711]|uniref:glycosyltransferase family 2 protein n=1 Tax=Mucilaginibacter sp. UYCu711 TaxID=3156339 RepID=UPI003D236361
MQKISVCIPTYNGEFYIKEQLDSILYQLLPNDEIVISDDSSTDQTLTVIKSLSEPRIKIFEGNKFRSPIYNIENAIRHSKGDIIVLADQDDVWLPDRLKEIIDGLQAADLVLTNAFVVDDKLNKYGNTLFESLQTKKGFFENLKKNTYVGCCMAFNTSLKKKILPFPSNLPMHDQWIGLIAELHCKINFISKPSLLYRRHQLNASNTGSLSNNTIYTKLKYRMAMLSAIILHGFNR